MLGGRYMQYPALLTYPTQLGMLSDQPLKLKFTQLLGRRVHHHNLISLHMVGLVGLILSGSD